MVLSHLFLLMTTSPLVAGEGLYSQLVEMVRSGRATFVEAAIQLNLWDWASLHHAYASSSQKERFEMPIWQEKQCNVRPTEARKHCSCFEMLNMGDQWLNRSHVSHEEYRQLRRRASLLHHADRSGGSEQAMLFLNECAILLYGDERCKSTRSMSQTAKKRK